MDRELTESFEFSTREFLTNSFSLPIFNDLLAVGVLDQNTMLRLTLAFQEAVTNSVEHGNLELRSEWKEETDSSGKDLYSSERSRRIESADYGERKVRIESIWKSGVLTISITDSGPGFDAPDQIAQDAEHDQVHGRGLAIIASIMDKVSYQNNGRVVQLIKKLG